MATILTDPLSKTRVNETLSVLNGINLVQCRFLEKSNGCKQYRVKLIANRENDSRRQLKDEFYDTISLPDDGSNSYKNLPEIILNMVKKRRIDANYPFYTMFLGLDRPHATRFRDTLLALGQDRISDLLNGKISFDFSEGDPNAS